MSETQGLSARVGVVIPAFDAADYLGTTLDSLLAQTFEHWICVVVDDGSTDATGLIADEYAARDARIRSLSQANAGQVVARNAGFTAIEHEIDLVSFMDADDVWRPHALTSLVAAVAANPEMIGAHGLAEFIDDKGDPLLPGTFSAFGRHRLGCRGGRPRPWPVERPTTFENVVTQSVLYPPGLVLARAQAYRTVGLFDERHRKAEDWEMLMRLTRTGDLAFVDEVILDYRRHDANVGASSGVAEACALARRSVFYSSDNSVEQQATLRDAWRAAQVIDARQRIADGINDLRHRSLRSAVATLSRLPLVAGRYVRGGPRPLAPAGGSR